MLNNKGQIFTTDLLVGLTVLLFVLVISTSSFGLIQNSLNQEEFYGEMLPVLMLLIVNHENKTEKLILHLLIQSRQDTAIFALLKYF